MLLISAAITEALERIRALEKRPDYMGPHISREIDDARHALGLADGIEYVADEFDHRENVSIPDEWIEDVMVGAVSRGCDRWGWRFFTSGSWWGEELDFYRAHITDRDSALVATAEGASRALAALLAWEAAIGGGEKDE